MMGLQCAVCFHLSMALVDGLHYNHVFVTGGKRLKREVGLFEQASVGVLNHLISFTLK